MLIKKQINRIGIFLAGVVVVASAAPLAPIWKISDFLTLDARDDEHPDWVFGTNTFVLDTRMPGSFAFSGALPTDTRSWATGLVWQTSTDASLSLEWGIKPSDVRGIDHYAVDYREFGSTGVWDTVTTPNLNATVAQLQGGTVYDLRVRPVIGIHTQEWTNLQPEPYTDPGLVYTNEHCEVYQHAWTHQHGEEVGEDILDFFSERVVEEIGTSMFTHWISEYASHISGLSVSSSAGLVPFAVSVMGSMIGQIGSSLYGDVYVLPYYPRQSGLGGNIKIFEKEPVVVEVFLDLSTASQDLDGEIYIKTYATGFVDHPKEERILIPDDATSNFKAGKAYRILLKEPLVPWEGGWSFWSNIMRVQAVYQSTGSGAKYSNELRFDVWRSEASDISFYTRGDLSDGGSFAIICYEDGRYDAVIEIPSLWPYVIFEGGRIKDGGFNFDKFELYAGEIVKVDGQVSLDFGATGEPVFVELTLDGYENGIVVGSSSNMVDQALASMSMLSMAETTYSSSDVPPGLHVMEEGGATVYILVGTDGNYLLAVGQNGLTESVGGMLNPDGSISASSGDLTFNATWGAGDVFSGSFTLGTNATTTVETQVHHSTNSIYAWYEDHFGTNLVLSSKALNCDDDADGLSFLMEYLCGLNPLSNDAWQATGMEITTNASGEQVVSRWFDVDTDSEAVSYAFSGSQSLTNWFVLDPGFRTMEETNGTLRIQYDVPIGTNTAQFIRFKAEM